MLALDCYFSYDDYDPRVWCDILNFEVDRKVYFKNIYDCMLNFKDAMLIVEERAYKLTSSDGNVNTTSSSPSNWTPALASTGKSLTSLNWRRPTARSGVTP